MTENPFAPPEAEQKAVARARYRFPGISRAMFLVWLVVVPLIPPLALPFAAGPAMNVVVVGFLVVGLVMRVQNVGWSGWWAIIAFVPFLNFLMIAACLVLPTEYAQTRRIDVAGQIMAVLLVAVVGWRLLSLLTG